jgi:hypothetical protein
MKKNTVLAPKTKEPAQPAAPVQEDNGHHPFLAWFARLWHREMVTTQGKDMLLDDTSGRRFAVGVDDDATPALGILEIDVPCLTSVPWTSAAFLFGHKGRDWIALSSQDIRVEEAEADEAVPVRLWIPMVEGLLDIWEELQPKQLRLRTVQSVGGTPVFPDVPPLAEIPLTIKVIVKD